MKLEDLSLVQAAGEIRSLKLSSLDYTQTLLARIASLEPRLKAWVTLDGDRALAEARACDVEARAGKFRGALHGVPIGLKDIFCTEGLRTTAGSKFLQDFTPDHDALSVSLLKSAGAIVLGKTVTTEFASFDPGPTCNPWNTAHTPGGSSSGSAAAVAARMCPAATGSQTVASIGRPAAFCGIVGFMPTQARVSRAGVFPVSWALDHIGGVCRTVADAHLFLEVLSSQAISKAPVDRPIRMGALRGFFASKASPETKSLHESLLQKLASPNVIIEEAQLPVVFDIQAAVLSTILRTEVASAHAEYYDVHSALYGKKLRGMIETGLLVDAPQYLRAMRLRKVFQREMARLFEKFDVLISPGATGTAPEGLEYTGDPGFSGPWALADFPTLTLPYAVGGNGLPVGIQISAPPMREDVMFGVGAALEQAIGFTDRPLP